MSRPDPVARVLWHATIWASAAAATLYICLYVIPWVLE